VAKQHYVEVMVRPVAAPGAAAQVARQLEVQLGGKIQLKVEARVDRRMAADLAAIRKTADETASALNRMAAAGAKPAAALETTARSARSASAAIKHLNELTARGTTHAERFGQQIGLAAQRFGAFTAATAGVFALTSALGKAVSEAVAFDLALNKLRQVSDGSAAEIRTMGREIGDLSVRLGVSSKELAEVSVQFAQAGLNAKQTREALQAVAQTALAPNFESMKQTTEGAIAAFQQFGRDASKLKDQLGAMNAVAGAFAVEAQDLVVATQKAGGSFSALGGDLNELLGLFTSVRATTRESAESIATGLRTIFARLQRQDTVDALSNLNIQLRYTAAEATALGRVDLQGQFVGAYEAVRRLSEGLEGLRTTDPKFAQVTEQLGGYRQISRVIPLLQQFGEAQKAVNVARLGGVSLAINEAQRMEAVSNRITRMGEAWQKVFNDAGQSRGVQQLADALERVVTLLAQIAPLAVGTLPVLAGAAVGFGARAAVQAAPNVLRPHDYKPHTPPPRRFAAGGLVPGVGNTDSVPLMLPTGSFVVRKQAVQAIGADNLSAMAGRYASGGVGGGSGASPALVMPGEYIVPPQAARSIGYGRLYGLNAAGRGTIPRFADGGIHEELKRLGLYEDYSSVLGSVAGSSVRIGNRSVPGAELVGRAAIKIGEMSGPQFAKSLVEKGGFEGDAEAAMAAAANDPAARANVRAAMKRMVFKLSASLAERATKKARDGAAKTTRLSSTVEAAAAEVNDSPDGFEHRVRQAARRVSGLYGKDGPPLRMSPAEMAVLDSHATGRPGTRTALDTNKASAGVRAAMMAATTSPPAALGTGIRAAMEGLFEKEELGRAYPAILAELGVLGRPDLTRQLTSEAIASRRTKVQSTDVTEKPSLRSLRSLVGARRDRGGAPLPPKGVGLAQGPQPVDAWEWMVENARLAGAGDYRPPPPKPPGPESLRVSGIDGRAARALVRARGTPAYVPAKTPSGDRLSVQGQFAEDRVDVRELLDRLAAATGIDPRGLTRGVFVDRGVTPGQAAAHGPGFRGSFNTKTGLTRINADQGIPETELARVIAHEVFGHGGDKALADRDVFDRIVRQATPALFKRLKKQEASAEHMAYAASPVETFARVMEDAVLAQAGIANESPLSRGLSQKVDPTDLAAAMNAARAKNPNGATPGGPGKPPTVPPVPSPPPPGPPGDDDERRIPRIIKDMAERQRLASQAVADESDASVAMGGKPLTLAEAKDRMRAMRYGDVPLPDERRAYRDAIAGPMGGGTGYVDRTAPPHLPPRDPPRQVGFLDNVNAEASVRFRDSGLYSKATADPFDTADRTRDGYVDLSTGGTRAQKVLQARQKELMAAIERDARKAGAERREAKLLAQELTDRITLDNMSGVDFDRKGRLTGPSSDLYSQLGQGRLFAVANAEEWTGKRKAGDRGWRRAAGAPAAALGWLSRKNAQWNDALERRGVNTTAVAIGAGAIAGVVGERFNPNESQLAAAGRSESGAARVAGSTTLSSTLSGAAMGLGVGAAFGPVGAGVGLAVGAAYGLANGLKEAARQIADAKIGAAVEDLGSSLGRVGRGLNSLNDLSDVTTTITTLRNEAAGKAAAEVGSDRPLEEQRAANLKQFRLAAGPQLFAAGQALSKESERLAKESPGGTAAQFEAKLRGSPNASALAGLLADLGVYRDFNEAVKELGKETAKAAAAIKVKNQLDADQANTRRAAAFLGQLAEVAERAADGLGGMRDRLDVLAGGRPGPRGLADSLDLFTADREGRGAAIGALRAQGATGGAFADRLDVLAKVADRLPDALTALAGNADERGLQGLIGGDTAAEKQVAAAIANALEAAASKDGGSLAKLLSEGVGPLAQQLIGEQADPVLAQARRFQGVRDAQRQFLAEGFGRGEQVGAEARGFRADAGRLGGDVAAAERAARARAGGFDPTDLATLGELRRPFLSAQDDLLKGTGLTSASTPEELGAALRRNQDARTLNVEKVRPTAQTADEIFAVEREFARLADVGARTKAALENLAKSGELAAAAQQKVAAADGSLNSRRSTAERALFADPAERARMGRQILAAQDAARNKDGFLGLGRTRQRDVIAGLNELGDSRLPTGERADQLKKVFLDQLLGGSGQGGLQQKELSEREAADKEYVEALKTQREAAAKLADDAAARQAEFLGTLKEQFNKFFAASEKGFGQAQSGQDLQAVAVAAREKEEVEKRSAAAKFLRDRLGVTDDQKLNAVRAVTAQEAKQTVDGRRGEDAETRIRQKAAERLNRKPGESYADLAASENVQPLKLRSSYGAGVYTDEDVENSSGQLITSLGFEPGSDLRKKVVEARKNEIAYNPLPWDKTVSAEVVAKNTMAVARRVLDEEDAFSTEELQRTKQQAVDRYFKGDKEAFFRATGNRRSGLARYELEQKNKGLDAYRLSTFTDDELRQFEEAKKLLGGKTLADVAKDEADAERKLREAQGKVKKAAGGWVSRGGAMDPDSKGTDTVPAVLSPDEFVVDARTAKANAPLLEWMRGRGRPVYRADGGFAGGFVPPKNPTPGSAGFGMPGQAFTYGKDDYLGWNALPATAGGTGGLNAFPGALPAGLGGTRPKAQPQPKPKSPTPPKKPTPPPPPPPAEGFGGGFAPPGSVTPGAAGFGTPGQAVAFDRSDVLGWNPLPGTAAGFGGGNPFPGAKPASLGGGSRPRTRPKLDPERAQAAREAAAARRQTAKDLRAERAFYNTGNAARLAYADPGQARVAAGAVDFARRNDEALTDRNRRLAEAVWGPGGKPPVKPKPPEPPKGPPPDEPATPKAGPDDAADAKPAPPRVVPPGGSKGDAGRFPTAADAADHYKVSQPKGAPERSPRTTSTVPRCNRPGY
jgi:TP901 family phage tail tape measure protein